MGITVHMKIADNLVVSYIRWENTALTLYKQMETEILTVKDEDDKEQNHDYKHGD